MTSITKIIAATAAAAGFFALTATGASAYMACSGNVCWHVHDRYHYPRHAHVVVHADTWRHGPSITIREHEGRGYWKGDSWTSW